MADYNKTELILTQNELQANGLNNPPNHYMSTGVGGKKTKSKTMKKGGNCGCDKNIQTLLHKQGGKKYKKQTNKKRTNKKSYKNKKTM